MRIAADTGRDAIASALFRAGTNLTARSCDCCKTFHLHNEVHKKLLIRPQSNVVWILKVILDLRKKVFDHKNDICELCHNNCCLLKFPCNHIICENCFWTDYLNLTQFCDIRCALCGIEIMEYVLISHEIKRNDKRVTNYLEIAESDLCNLSVIELKQKSFCLWQSLPESEIDHFDRRTPFCALSLRGAASLYIKETQAGRSGELHLAASRGDRRRVYALVGAGVNLDCRNEYGQTALFLATWHNNIDTVRLLLAFGCDPNIFDNCGVSAIDIAHVQKNIGIYALLKASERVNGRDRE
jgi:hypothetical protein